ncbi:hypothetical protein [uncultured Aquimarina sp.]|uniref:hypothetical protein n=1 Tax=uncultured Aquimarina sp. TaxID=575652 RepID=UPI0026304AC3|nr:hypothetical protein [uncultured Aquimarina sp.]
MRAFIILLLLFICTTSIAQPQVEDQDPKEKLKLVETQLEEVNKRLEQLAEQRAILLQQELNLSNYASDRIKKVIIKYSIKANKIIQSNASANEKTKDLTNIVYFQNEEFKKVLTVHQFYKYLKLTDI